MSLLDARGVPADQRSTDRLAEQGLHYRRVDIGDAAQARAFQRAVARGFLGAEPNDETLEHQRAPFEARRNIGVFDGGAGSDALPVASINSWVTPMTVPGGGELAMWAISAVTVAATHRRRGIARALLEGDLRAASASGVAIAGLTATEATIYGRYGFGAAVPVARFTVDARRAGWAGESPGGRLELIERESLAEELADVHERARTSRSGQIQGWQRRWDGLAGLAPSDSDRDRVRGVRYIDDAGRTRGVMSYTLREKGDSFVFELHVRMLVAETADAVAALWRFALQHDLVGEVTADLRPVDDPLPWLVADTRAVTQVVHDHGWLRILDVPAALTARTYSAPLDVGIRIEDDLGFADGAWRLRVDGSGSARVDPEHTVDPDVTMSAAALSTLYAGAVRPSTLHAAGRVHGAAETIELMDRAFTAYPAPTLDIWY